MLQRFLEPIKFPSQFLELGTCASVIVETVCNVRDNFSNGDDVAD